MEKHQKIIFLLVAIAFVFAFSPFVLAEETAAEAPEAPAAEAQESTAQESPASEPVSDEAMSAIADEIKSVDLGQEQCDEPETVTCPEPEPCPECPPPPKCPELISFSSNDAILAVDRESSATQNLAVLRDEVAVLLKAKSVDKDHVANLIIETEIFMDMYRELPLSAEALFLKAELLSMSKLYEARLITLTKLLFEYPDGDFAETAVTGIRGLYTGKLKKALKFDKGITKGTSQSEWADRYAQALEMLHEFNDAKYLPFLMAEYNEFLSRYPRHKFAETALRFKAEGYATTKNHESRAFALTWFIKLYPDSEMRSAVLFDLATVYEESLKEYGKAVQTYELLVADYPEGEQTLASYQRAAEIYDKKLKNTDGAVKSLEAIVTRFPGDKAALAAFLYMADLQQSKKQYAKAVRSLNSLADMFKGDDAAVKALVDSAKIASVKMKDYELQIQVQSRLVDEYPNREEAVIALNAIAETNVKQLDNTTDAINVYKALIKQYPDHKLAEAARKKVDKLLGQ
ncbi:MAG: tetratricopeptide repeat protein [Thermodesulfovibrionales bacterium]|nr:tetratricopeptide repeat protein [Thermodesulfovibrionales bacterium]